MKIDHAALASSASQARLVVVAEILATGLIRLRDSNPTDGGRPVDLDNASEERVTVRALNPPQRDRRDVH